MLTRKQQELLLYIDAKLKEGGVSPSFEEMKEALDLKSKSGVHRLISALEERGFIRRLPNRARALEVLKMPDVRAAPSRRTSTRPPPRRRAPPTTSWTSRCTAGSPPARRSRRCRAPTPSPSPPPCSARASIMRWRSPAIRWSTRAFSTATMRLIQQAGDGPRRRDRRRPDQRGGSDPQDLPPRRPDDPPRPRQPDVRSATLPPRSGADPRQAGGAAAALLTAEAQFGSP